jgi:hypothetical protein
MDVKEQPQMVALLLLLGAVMEMYLCSYFTCGI